MALQIGDLAPDFTLPATDNTSFSLRERFGGKPCIVFFYPKDFTPACTQEACTFRDSMPDFASLEVDVVGISRDSIASHRKFKEANALSFELLSDEKGNVCRAYDALIPILALPKRVTYLLDAEHRVVAVVNNMFNPKAHVEELLEAVKKKAPHQ